MKNLFFFLIIAVVFSACTKDKIEALPPITQEGANTFGCVINGKIYLPKGFEQNKPNFQTNINPIDSSFRFEVFRKEGVINTRLNFGSDSICNTGLFLVGSRTDFAYSIYSNQLSGHICETPYSYSAPSNKTGFMKITRYDLVNKIFSGEFEFQFVNPDCGIDDTVFIKQGRFDLKF